MKCNYLWYAGFCSQMRHMLFITVSFSRSLRWDCLSLFDVLGEKWTSLQRNSCSSCESSPASQVSRRKMSEDMKTFWLFAWASSLIDFSLKNVSTPFRSLWLFSISNGANSSVCFQPHIFNIQLPKPEDSVPSNHFDTFFCSSRSHFRWFSAQSSDLFLFIFFFFFVATNLISQESNNSSVNGWTSLGAELSALFSGQHKAT